MWNSEFSSISALILFGIKTKSLRGLFISSFQELLLKIFGNYYRIQLPDLQVVDARLDYSVPVLKVTQELCRELGIRYPEELSLKRDIPPDILRKGANIESENQIQPYIKLGEVSYLLIKVLCAKIYIKIL